MTKNAPIPSYLDEINKALKAGTATEHTYRPALKGLVEAIAAASAMEVIATNEPKQVACGAPDFVITANTIPLGHIEAKDVGVDLDKIEKSEQIKRYLDGLPNLILTDYLEFRWYVFGEHRLTATLDHSTGEGLEDVSGLIGEFLRTKIKTITTPSNLAKRMGGLARLMRSNIRLTFMAEDKGGELHDQLKGFRQVLIEDLSEDDFADMYAQTICYGLFAALCNHKGKESFTRYKAAHELPKTNPFLRKIFGHIAGPELNERVTWIVDDLAELLDRTDIVNILKDFGRRTRREDPVVHFYETFLAEYDPTMREKRGVYYTPEPIVSYIVKSVDEILKRDFKISDGLADYSKVKVSKTLSGGKKEAHRVTILDPATGTGTFLRDVIATIRAHIESTGQIGSWSSYVSQHLLPRIFGFELLMAPYAVCHMKLGLQLADTGYDFRANERLRVYLTNSLQEAHEMANLPLFSQELAREAIEAGEAKQDYPVMVVLGNPPYSGHSVNEGEWMQKLMRGFDTITDTKTENYFEVDGQPLGERNPKWLNDDYVKFIRFPQWRIEQTGHGILAFVTNHGYLDNPTFRGMRQSLMTTFNDIYVLDLHGNTKKKEKTPDGTADKNVFDIQQGVSIGIFVKKKNSKSNKPATARHAELWGTRDGVAWAGSKHITMGGKYDWLYKHDVKSTEWTKLNPTTPHYFLRPLDMSNYDEYDIGWSIVDIMPVNSVGIATARDSLTIHWTRDDVREVVMDFSQLPQEEARNKYKLKEDVRDWKVHLAQEDIRNHSNIDNNIKPIHYRPFDNRYTHYTGQTRGFHCMPRPEVMGHMIAGDNLALITSRLTKGETYAHVQCTRYILEVICMSSKTSNNGFGFPLYLYPNKEKGDLFDIEADATDVPGGRRPNLAKDFIDEFKKSLKLDWVADGTGNLKKTFGPEDVFHYMYAIFHCPIYRDRYGEFLKIDFPRLPLISDVKLFGALCKLGRELTGLHLMEAKASIITSYTVDGDHVVDKLKYAEPKDKQPGRMWINKTQYFEGVPLNV